MSILRTLIAACAAVLVSLGGVNAAAVDYFLKIPGAEGESTSRGETIQIESWSWGETNAGAPQRGPGTVDIVLRSGDATNALKKRLREGTKLNSLILGGWEGGKPVTYELYSVKVTSFSVNGSSLDDGSIPTETLSLNFEEIKLR